MYKFCRLFLSVEEEGDRSRIEIRVRPDREQAPRGKTLAVIHCSSFEDLGASLDVLGVTGVSRFLGESELGPLAEHIPTTVAEVIQRVRTVRPCTVTLIAAETSIDQMNRRLEVLKAKRQPGIRITDPA